MNQPNSSAPTNGIYKFFVDNSLDGLVIVDAGGVIRFANPAAVALLRDAAPAAIGFHIGIPAINRPTELVVPLRNGHRYVEMVAAEVTWQNNPATLASLRDVTDRIKAEQALRDSESQLRQVLENIDEIMYVVEVEAEDLLRSPARFISGRVKQILGYDPEQFTAERGFWRGIIHAEDLPGVEQQTRMMLATSNVATREYRVLSGLTGNYRWLEDRVVPQKDSSGRVFSLIGVIRDVTERKSAEQRINHLTRLYATLSNINKTIVYARSEPDLFDRLCRIAVDPGQMFGSTVRMADTEAKLLRHVASSESMRHVVENTVVSFDPADPNFSRTITTAYLEDRVVLDNEYVANSPDEPKRAIPFSAGVRSAARIPIRRGGEPVGVLSLNSTVPGFFDPAMGALLEELVLDISFALDNFEYERRRKRAENMLIESEGQFRGLVEQSVSGIVISQEGLLTYVNPRAVEIFGYGGAAEVLGHELIEFVSDKDRAALAASIGRLLSREVESAALAFTGLRKDGTTVEVGAHGTHATYRGRPAIIGVIQDITERKRAEEETKRYVVEIEAAMMATVRVASTMGEMRDPYTAGHERRVAELTAAIGEEMGLSPSQIEGLRVAGNLHDIGKITVPAEILSKPGKISAVEFSLIKEHAQQGYEILKGVRFPWPVAEVAQQHHERIDGSGYPQGLKGDEIILEARILAVADTVEAMSSHRPYRPGRGLEAALAEVGKLRGTKYDPIAVDACLRLFREKNYQLPD